VPATPKVPTTTTSTPATETEKFDATRNTATCKCWL
jgi:hypothetical protein